MNTKYVQIKKKYAKKRKKILAGGRKNTILTTHQLFTTNTLMRMPDIPCAEGHNYIDQESGLIKVCAWGDKQMEEELVGGVLRDYLQTHPEELEVRREQLKKEHPDLSWEEVSTQAVWEIKRAVCRVSHGICPIHLEKFCEQEEVRGKEVDERHEKHVSLQYAQELRG